MDESVNGDRIAFSIGAETNSTKCDGEKGANQVAEQWVDAERLEETAPTVMTLDVDGVDEHR